MAYYPRIDWGVGVAMARRGCTHAELARDLGMSDRALREKRLGRREFKASEVVSLSRACGLPLGLLLSESRAACADGGALALPRGRYYSISGERGCDGER